MKTLGLCAYTHDTAACLMDGEKILGFIEEERLNRVKNYAGFPELALKKILSDNDCQMRDIDRVGFFWNPTKELTGNLSHFVKFFPDSLNLLKAPSGSSEYSFIERVLKMYGVSRDIKRTLNARSPKVDFFNHHYCHAASAFYCSEFSDAAILVIDGRGESISTSIWKGEGGNLKLLYGVKVPHSLGHLFASVTEHLGYRSFYDEWKVMGLAAFGTRHFQPAMDSVVKTDRASGFQLNLDYFRFHTHGRLQWTSPKFSSIFGASRSRNEPLLQTHADLAFALQKKVEEIGVHLAAMAFELSKSHHLCLTGGVALNCLMNQKIVERTAFKDFFIQPIAGDAGSCLGAAILAQKSHFQKGHRVDFKHLYLGPRFSDEQIEHKLKSSQLSFSKSSDIASDAAQLLSQGSVLGWFQGAMEAGPRALGNRSILANPATPGIKKRLNMIVKKREFFRPFAPSVLEERAGEFFDVPHERKSPFMILAAEVKASKRGLLPAITHEDGTARLQTVSSKTNPLYWKLIHQFEKQSGIPVLLNTSFNENEPIVCSPDDAISCFKRSDFDALAIGNYLVKKT